MVVRGDMFTQRTTYVVQPAPCRVIVLQQGRYECGVIPVAAYMTKREY